MSKTIHDTNRDGTLEIADTNWDHNGTLRVTIRDLEGMYPVTVSRERQARYLAKQALDHAKTSTFVRRFIADGCMFTTFTVSRLDD